MATSLLLEESPWLFDKSYRSSLGRLKQSARKVLKCKLRM